MQDFRKNDTPLFLQELAGPIGTRGIAIPTKSDDGTVFLIDKLFDKAKCIEFILVNELLVSQQFQENVTVDSYWDGMNPGDTVKLYNKSSSAQFIFEGASGAKGLAKYIDKLDRYIIWQLECPDV